MAKKMAMLLRPPKIPRGRTLFRRALDALNPPRRAFEILRVWFQQAQSASEFAGRYFPKSEVVIIGHFHSQGVWVKSGRLVINTGAYVSPHRSLWVSYEDGLLKVGRVKERDGAFGREDALEVWSL